MTEHQVIIFFRQGKYRCVFFLLLPIVFLSLRPQAACSESDVNRGIWDQTCHLTASEINTTPRSASNRATCVEWAWVDWAWKGGREAERGVKEAGVVCQGGNEGWSVHIGKWEAEVKGEVCDSGERLLISELSIQRNAPPSIQYSLIRSTPQIHQHTLPRRRH